MDRHPRFLHQTYGGNALTIAIMAQDTQDIEPFSLL